MVFGIETKTLLDANSSILSYIKFACLNALSALGKDDTQIIKISKSIQDATKRSRSV